MATNTTRLGLIKPDYTDDVDIADINSNMDDIDSAVGATICTSTTRPGSPFTGQLIFETNTDKFLVWTGSVWEESVGGLSPTNVVTPTAGQKLVFNGTNWVNVTGYVYVSTVYFTSSGTFEKADYPWLRAIRVKCQGAGGGGGSVNTTASNQNAVGGGGAGGAYAESFITDIAGLDVSVTVTRGAGGAGGTGGGNNGSSGGSSSFGALVSANGGDGGVGRGGVALPNVTSGTGATTTGTGDFVVPGSGCPPTFMHLAARALSNLGGNSFLGAGANNADSTSGANGNSGIIYGGGGSGGVNSQSQASTRNGGAGANGIVIVELYA
jgi:hypothetical protein